MKQGRVFNNNNYVGVITQINERHYTFEYDAIYFENNNMPAISLTLPKTKIKFESQVLFPFFFSLLSEGSNKKLQSNILQIDEEDHFEFLLKTAHHETIGAIKVEEVIYE
jgi:HipA-like protein